jgi:DNA-directed RNA polymerase subunit RPC12/RpoP
VDADVPANERRHTERIERGKEMKEHFCPAEQSMITYQGECSWCGEREALAQTQQPVAVYGYCPQCGAKGVMRERRPNGNDKCANGHTYPSRLYA